MGLNAPHVTPEELRSIAGVARRELRPLTGDLIDDAADTIEAQAAEVERLRAFVAAFDAWEWACALPTGAVNAYDRKVTTLSAMHAARRAIDEAQA